MARVTVNGQQLSQRVAGLLDDARAGAGLQPSDARVVQGSWSTAVSASAGTHSGGGAVDLSVSGLTLTQQLVLVDQLRRRNGCAWLRTPTYGWPASAGGPHIHCIVRDEPDLAPAARAQVAAYDKGLNGLASKRRDPFTRPTQRPVEEVRAMPKTLTHSGNPDDDFLSVKQPAGTDKITFHTFQTVKLRINGATQYVAEQTSGRHLLAAYYNLDLPPALIRDAANRLAPNPLRAALARGGVRTWFQQIDAAAADKRDETGYDGPWPPPLFGDDRLLISRVWPHTVDRDAWEFCVQVSAYDAAGGRVDVPLVLDTREAKIIGDRTA